MKAYNQSTKKMTGISECSLWRRFGSARLFLNENDCSNSVVIVIRWLVSWNFSTNFQNRPLNTVAPQRLLSNQNFDFSGAVDENTHLARFLR